MKISLLYVLQPPVTSSILGPHVLLETLFSIPNLRSSLNVRDRVSRPHKTRCNITVFNTLIFMFLDSTQEDKKILNCIVASIPGIQSALNSLTNAILIC
jgi:hypothetical protein